jgi:transposase-like protein
MKDGDMPKIYDLEFKARAVRLVRDHLSDYGSVTAASFAVGAQLGVSREMLRRWVVQAQVEDGIRPRVTTAEAEEIRRLKAEVKRLRKANETSDLLTVFGMPLGSVACRGRRRDGSETSCRRRAGSPWACHPPAPGRGLTEQRPERAVRKSDCRPRLPVR